MIDVGAYSLVFYNRAGTKLKIKTVAVSYTRALVLGYRVIKWVDQEAHIKHRPVSFTVDRRLFNSLDKHDNW